MEKRKRFTRILSPEDVLDVTIHYEKKTLHKFALNYRSRIDDRWETIYRVDNEHKGIHEHKFWKDDEAIPIKDETIDFKIINKFVDQIFNNYEKYKKYFIKSETRKDDETPKFKKRTEKESARSQGSYSRDCQ